MKIVKLEQWITRNWYRQDITWWLLPFAILFRMIVAIRWMLYQKRMLPVKKATIPVIVVGNITVGGTGKTPCVIALVELLKAAGLKPGIVSRGYGGKSNKTLKSVELSDGAQAVGDEALLLKRRCDCPVVIARKRALAVDWIATHTDCNIIISDDGLQHYGMDRDFEIVILDGERGFGNKRCLPAGPLREPISRLKYSDLMIINGHDSNQNDLLGTIPIANMQPIIQSVYPLTAPHQSMSIPEFNGQTIHAVAGIGNPARFFNALAHQGLHVIVHAFSDHHVFSQADFDGFSEHVIFLTEKDAVKCESFTLPNAFVVRIDGVLDETVGQVLHDHLGRWALP